MTALEISINRKMANQMRERIAGCGDHVAGVQAGMLHGVAVEALDALEIAQRRIAQLESQVATLSRQGAQERRQGTFRLGREAVL